VLSVRVVAEKAATDTQDNILAASAISIADALYPEKGEIRLELPYSALSMLGTISEDRVFYRVVLGENTLTGYQDLPLPKGSDVSRDPTFETILYKEVEVRTVAITRVFSSGTTALTIHVIVGQTRLGLEATSSKITATATGVGLGFFILAIALSIWAAQNTLKPINRLALSVTRRGPADLRPVTTETPAELVPLVTELNRFILRAKATLLRSEEFIAEAAHHIRTPLATVRTQAEVFHRQMNKPENRKTLRNMIRAVDESSRSAGQLLDHAMITFRTDQLAKKQIELGQLLEDVCSRLAPTAELRDIEVQLTRPDEEVFFEGDAILLQSALRNILENAIKYSPDESDITVCLEIVEGCYHLAFIDQGRGFGETDKTKLTSRFSRGSNVSDVIGSGLGLTIVADVAKAHGGHLTINSNEKGPGACVILVLPSS
jgi:two-component system sensor histidine kinase TctE